MNKSAITLILLILYSCGMSAEAEQRMLSLPNREQLSSDKLLFVMQDSEGFLWYGTDGGGICRDDGRQIDIFRSDAEHPNLLGSNTVVCMAESGCNIIIGTTHGANVLDKHDYSISRLTEVDDNRVDDILVTTDGRWWLTSNKKVYEYSADGRWQKTYSIGDKYIFRLYESPKGQVWCREWEGGTLRLAKGRFVRMTTAWLDSISFNRTMVDHRGCRLVSDGIGKCYALSSEEPRSWFDSTILTREQCTAIQQSLHLSARPTAVAMSKGHDCWFSTGKDIRCKKKGIEETVISDTKDVSAMAFTPDGTLWLATIYGQLYRYDKGKVTTDEYGSNEYGDGVRALSVDSMGRLLLVSDRYIRLYDTQRHTLRQQSRESDDTYIIELQETKPGERWSQPRREKVIERIPQWLTSWWMWCVYMLLMVGVVSLIAYNIMLRHQRRKFLQLIKNTVTAEEGTTDMGSDNQSVPVVENEWIKKVIAQVESHLSDETYTVEQLSADLCMSRMTFYRKIQSQTGQSPTEFVRTIRLRRAAVLLREGRLTVTEISYATGFSSLSYFSRCFRTMFGVPPTQYGKDSAIR